MKHESDTLKLYLQKAQENITVLLEEKRKLLEKVRGLQVRIKELECLLFAGSVNKQKIFYHKFIGGNK